MKETVATVVDYADTRPPRWRRRAKGGSRDVRRYGEPAAGAPTLCDEIGEWQTECRGSDANRCEVVVAHRTTCDAYCEAHGLWCEAAWDDRGASCERAASERAECSVRRASQICACRRSCVDGGPWACHEEGCPAREVSCRTLSVACAATFSSIWRVPPPGTKQLRVRQACPLACGACTSPAPPTANAVPAWLTGAR